MDIDYYEVLGVERTADATEIRKAYKRAALVSHPDKVPEAERDAAEIRFKMVCEAYETLSDPSARAHYDTFGAGGSGPDWQNSYDPGFGPEAFAEFFGFTNGFNVNGFGDPNGGYGAYTNGSSNGATNGTGFSSSSQFRRNRGGRTPDAEVEISVTLADIYKGRVLKLSSNRDALCKACSGTGARPKATPKVCGQCSGSGSVRKLKPLGHGLMTASEVPCDACHGHGSIYRAKDLCKRCSGQGTSEEKSILEVYIPRGARDGHRIVLEGRADEAYGKETGDIVVTVKVEQHAVFTRVGQDLHAEVTISLYEALVGLSRVLVTHLDGRGIQVTVPRGTVTKPGAIFKVSNEGLPNAGKETRGNLYLHVSIDFPDKIDSNKVDSLHHVLPQEPTKLPSDKPRDVDEVEHTVMTQEDLPRPSDGEYESKDHPNGCATM